MKPYVPRVVVKEARLHVPDSGDLDDAKVTWEEPERPKRSRRSRRVGMSFVMVDAVSMGDLELVPNEQKVLSALLSVADVRDESRSRMSTSMIAERTGIRASNVSTILAGLKKRRVVFKEGPGYWRVTPWYAFAGEWPEWDKTAKHFPEPQWKR
jgi:hypothetical protein